MAAVAYVVAAVMVLIDSVPLENRLVALGLVAAGGAWQFWFGRGVTGWHHEGRYVRAVAYLAVLFVLFVVAVQFATSASFLLFALVPQIYMALPLWWALPPMIAFTLVPWAGGRIVDFLPIVALVVVLSQVFAWTITTVQDKNREQAALVEELRSTQARNAELSHEAGVAAERERLAGEIHDTLAQGFTSIVTLVQAAQGDPVGAPKHLDLALRTARENLVEARALVAALAPTALSGSTLVEAIGRQADRLGEESGVVVRHRTTGEPWPLPTSVEVVLLRAAQEAFHNVHKHAHATSVEVELAFEPEGVRLSVCDDGVGIRKPEGFGLRGMRARVEQVGGTVTICGQTELTVWVPR
jgi:signal transduction histidine kinase